MAIIKVANRAIDLDAAEIPNLDASKITTGNFDASRIGSGTFADARISSSSVSQHAQSFDDNKIVNDISTLALRQASNENKAAYNTNSMYVDVFQDATGITNLSNASRNASEYIDTTVTTTSNPTVSAITNSGGQNNSPTFTINNTTGLITHDHTSTTRDYDDADVYGVRVDLGSTKTITSDFYLQMTDIFDDSGNANMGLCELNISTGAGSGYLFGSGGITPSVYTNANAGSWSTLGGNGSSAFYDQVRDYDGMYVNGANMNAIVRYRWTENSGTVSGRYIDVVFANTWGRPKTFNLLHNTTGSSVNPGGTNLGIGGTTSTFNATGSFESNAITAPSSTNKMGAIITYQDQAGTNALNTDIVLKLSADGGSNYATATMVAMPDFASGIKMAKVNDLSVTAGTSLKYKIEFANQASGSKEARIRGVSLQY